MTDCEPIALLEGRAAAAERAIAELKRQHAGGAALEERLRELLHRMQEDRQECEAIRAQRDELRQENERLRAQSAKHEYRVKHLLRTIDEMESSMK